MLRFRGSPDDEFVRNFVQNSGFGHSNENVLEEIEEEDGAT